LSISRFASQQCYGRGKAPGSAWLIGRPSDRQAKGCQKRYRRFTFSTGETIMIMGNDEFILYIRKRYPNCMQSTSELGRRIYQRIVQMDSNAHIVQEDAPCYWGDTGDFVAEDKLPKTAAQISFDPSILPQLFGFLDGLGDET
jgi:hypothetical protein